MVETTHKLSVRGVRRSICERDVGTRDGCDVWPFPDARESFAEAWRRSGVDHDTKPPAVLVFAGGIDI